jgi:EEF1A lysine methyltransferase 2
VENAVEWGLEHVPPSSNPSILDVGCGNGCVLIALVEAGYNPDRLVGIDYSVDAVKLASLIASNHGAEGVLFTTCDFLTENPPLLPDVDRLDSWDLVLDKGTFDAISLSERDHHGGSSADEYPQRIARILKPGGLFFIACAPYSSHVVWCAGALTSQLSM